MQIILTHSHTDFDGLAAQLAAARLFPGALPVLSAHLNEQVRAFLALAGEDLPFVRAEDLPRDPVERLILVDTDQAARLPILDGPPPPTLIVDHHPLARELGPGERRLEGEAGATTTLLTERLIEAGAALAPVEATLLLLGIYEDTGSLSLPDTRPADLACAAWLLGQGARLAAVGEFLGRPLSPAQEQVERDLERDMRVAQVAGWPVLLAAAQVSGSVPELSPVAHRLRDRYTPAAMAVAVGTSDAGTQLILRSAAEVLDSGALAARFGGGGHAAAAAAFVRGRPPGEVLPEVERALRELIRPALTAADLMTRQVRSIPPGASIAQAAALQERAGHTALPVVDSEGLVHGLVARRDLDRALRHGLGDSPVSRYMWRGPRLIPPELPLPDVRQALLDDEGRITGRLLVVDGERRLLGIVTRGDLLRALGGPPARDTDGHADTAAALERFLPPATLALVRRAAELAEAGGSALYIVGGTVRDMLLGRAPGDLDLVVEGDAIALAGALAAELGARVRSHAQFGTATIELGEPGDGAGLPDALDLVTARTEFYERPAALPEVEAASLRHDLHRRDFTINTLAVCLNPSRYGRLYDFYGGRRDLERRTLRVLHNLSFIDDPTRILRAARLAARLGCAIEPRTAALIADAVEHRLLERTSPARVADELTLALQEPQAERGLALLAELGALRAVDPALAWGEELEAWFAAAPAAAATQGELAALRLALLTYPMPAPAREALAERLRLPHRLARTLRDVGAAQGRLAELGAEALPDSQVDRLLRGLDDVALAAAQIAGPPAAAPRIARYRALLRDVRLEVDGGDLRALGLEPGPKFRELLDGLRAARLDGHAPDRAGQLAWARRAAGLEEDGAPPQVG